MAARHTEVSGSKKSAAAEVTDRPCIAIMGHVGVGNLGDEAIISAVVARLREYAPSASLIAFTLNPRDTTERHQIPAFPLRLYTERLMAMPPPDFSWSTTYTAKATGTSDSHARTMTGLGGWIRRRPLLKRLLRPGVLFARGFVEALHGLAFDSRSWRRLRNVRLLMWAGSGQVSDYVDGSFGYPLVILRWCVLARLRGAKIAFASSGAGPVTKPLSRMFIAAALKLSHYRSFRDPYSLNVARSLGAPEPNLLVRDLAFSSPLLSFSDRPKRANQSLSIGVNPLPFFGGEYWHLLEDSVYDKYVRAHAELAVGLLRRGYRVTLFPTNIRVDPRSIRAIFEVAQELAPDIATKLQIRKDLQDVTELLECLREFDLVVATRYHGVLLSLSCGTPAIAVVYHAKTREVAEHMGMKEWCVDADKVAGGMLLDRVDTLVPRLPEFRRSLATRRSVDRTALLDQYGRLAEIGGTAGVSPEPLQ